MPNPANPDADPRHPDPHATYELRVAGELDASWTAWFDGLEVSIDGADTLLTGPVADQAALHGLLRRVRDLGLTLVSVTRLEPPE